MRRLLSLLAAAALVLSLAACGGGETPPSSSQPPGQQEEQPSAVPFSLAVYSEYSIHPVLSESRTNLILSGLLYEPLFLVDESFQAVPVLCSQAVMSEDGLSWTFTLRSGVTFSDGTPLTGETAAAALELARGEGSRYAQRLQDVTAITYEENSLTITLSQPNGALPLLLDIPIALGEGERPLGTGPYVLLEEEDNLSLALRSGWWQDKAMPVQEIPLRAISKSDQLISAFDAGDVSLVETDLMGTNALGYSSSCQTWDYPTTDLLYLGFNTQKGLCRSSQVRLALALTVDRSAMVQVDFASHAAAAPLPVHPNSSLYSDNLAGALAYDPEQAVTRLEEAGALGQELTLLVNSENTAKVNAAQRLAQQLEAAGMEVTLSKLPFDEFTAALTQGSFDLYLGEVVLTADFDLSPLLSSQGSLNYGGWNNVETDSFLAQLKSAPQEQRAAAAASLFSHLNSQVPLVPICFKNGSVLTQWGRLSGLTPLRGNVFYQMENWIFS